MSQQKHRQQLTARRGPTTQQNFRPRVTKAQQRTIQARQAAPAPAATGEIVPQAAGELPPVQPPEYRGVFAKADAEFVQQANDRAWGQLRAAAEAPDVRGTQADAVTVDDSPETDDGPLPAPVEPPDYEA